MRILVATDFSEGSRAAVDEVAGRAWPAGSEIRLVSVVRPLDAAISEVFEREFVPSHADRAKRLLFEESQRLEAHGVSVSTAVAPGRTASAIVRAAQEWGADLVYVGRCGKHAVPRKGLGRTAKEVARGASCSVGVARPRPAAMLGQTARRILIAVDDAPSALDAARSVAHCAWPPGTRIAVVAASEALGSDARRLLEHGGLAAEAVTVDRAPHRRLVELSETWGADLVVFGGPTAAALEAAELADCTVEVTRGASRP